MTLWLPLELIYCKLLIENFSKFTSKFQLFFWQECELHLNKISSSIFKPNKYNKHKEQYGWKKYSLYTWTYWRTDLALHRGQSLLYDTVFKGYPKLI